MPFKPAAYLYRIGTCLFETTGRAHLTCGPCCRAGSRCEFLGKSTTPGCRGPHGSARVTHRLWALRRVAGQQQPAFNGGDAATADAEMKAQELRELTALGFPEQQARVSVPCEAVRKTLWGRHPRVSEHERRWPVV